MLRKILIILGILVVIGGGIGYYIYQSWQPAPLPISNEDRKKITLMPLPSKLTLKDGNFVLDGKVGIKWGQTPTDLFKKAESRFWNRLEAIKPLGDKETISRWIEINCTTNANYYPSYKENETYQIEISSQKVKLTAETSLGVLRGFQTLIQLAEIDDENLAFPACKIEDQPRYPWRGIMLDVSRHWMPKEVVLRTLDGMEAVKMNVFHWHLTDDQGFRIESKEFPNLHEKGSSGDYYTQEEVKEIIDYAADRGIRVIPEFDIPGHSLSWLVGYPEIGSGGEPYVLANTYGIKLYAMDPSKERTYEFLDTFLGEMAALFPDEYLHIGGDEVNPEAWKNNEQIMDFVHQNKLEDSHGLQAYFNQKIYKILESHGKKMVGWDEIIHPDLPQESVVIQAWRNHVALFEAAHRGVEGILSNGWYLDHKLPASSNYEINPDQVRGGITIEPDSIWQTYSLTLHLQDSKIPSQLTLFGAGEELRGVWKVMDNLTGFENAKLENDKLSFELNSSMGTVQFEASLTDGKLAGEISLALLKFNFSGEKTGGTDIAGTNPPELKRVPKLTEIQKENILGGEACMWSEVISKETVDSRIWPRTAAIAEKLWSPQALTEDVDDMYRRLDTIRGDLTSLGLTHDTYREPMLSAIAPNSPDLSALATFVNILEETKYYQRLGEMMGKPLDTPLEYLADAAAPESQTARLFSNQVDAFLADSTHKTFQKMLLRSLRVWEANNRPFVSTITQNPDLEPYRQMSSYLSAISRIGMKAVHAISNGEILPEEEKTYNFEMLDGASQSVLGAELAIVPAVRQLVEEAYKEKNVK